MLDTEKGKENGPRDFSEIYVQLCNMDGLCPRQAVTAQFAKRALDLNVDNIALNEWEPILKTISSSKFLCHIAFRSLIGLDSATNEGSKRRKKSIFCSSNICSSICKALRSCLPINKELVCFELQGIPLSSKDLFIVCQGMSKSRWLQHVSFEGCPIGDEGLAEICHILPGVPTISTLNLIRCSISAKGIPHLVKLIAQQALHRQSAAWQESLRYRIPNLDGLGGLRRVTLNDNPDIGDAGAVQLADALRDDLWIKAVDLQNCGVSNVGALAWLGILSETKNDLSTDCSITITEGGNRSLMVLDLRRNGLIAKDLLRVLTERVLLNSQGKQTQYNWLKRRQKEARRNGCMTDWPGLAGVQGPCSNSPVRIKRVNCHNFNYKPKPIKMSRPIVRPSFRPAGKLNYHYNKPAYQRLPKRPLIPKGYGGSVVKRPNDDEAAVRRNEAVRSEGDIWLSDLEVNFNNEAVAGIPWRTAARAVRPKEEKTGVGQPPRRTASNAAAAPDKAQAARSAKPPYASKPGSEYLLTSYHRRSRDTRSDLGSAQPGGEPTDLEKVLSGSRRPRRERCGPVNRNSQGDSSTWFSTSSGGGGGGGVGDGGEQSGGTVPVAATAPTTTTMSASGPLVYPARRPAVPKRDPPKREPPKPPISRRQSTPEKEPVKRLFSARKDSIESRLRYQLKKHMLQCARLEVQLAEERQKRLANAVRLEQMLSQESGELCVSAGLPCDIYTRLDSALSQVEILLRQFRDHDKQGFLVKNDEQQLRLLQAALRKLTGETKPAKTPAASIAPSVMTPSARRLGSAGVQFGNPCPIHCRRISYPGDFVRDDEQTSELASCQSSASKCPLHSRQICHQSAAAVPTCAMQSRSTRRISPKVTSSARTTRTRGSFDVPERDGSYGELSTQNCEPRPRSPTPSGEASSQGYNLASKGATKLRRQSTRTYSSVNQNTASVVVSSEHDECSWETNQKSFEASTHPTNPSSTKYRGQPAPPCSAPEQSSQRRLFSPETDLSATYDLASNGMRTRTGVAAEQPQQFVDETSNEDDVFEDLLPADLWSFEEDQLQVS